MTPQDSIDEFRRREVLSAVGGFAVLPAITMDSEKTPVASREIEEEIEHPLPETAVEYTRQTERGAVVRVSVPDANGWRYVQIWEQNATVLDTGGVGYSAVALTEGEDSTTLSTNMDGADLPEPVPWGSVFAISAFYDGSRSVYYGLLIVSRSGPFLLDAADIEDYCWWEQGGSCLQSHAIPMRLDTPSGVVYRAE